MYNSSPIHQFPRREFLFGAAALTAGVLLPIHESPAQDSSKSFRRIDIHHHFGPPKWCAFLTARNVLYPSWTGWTPALAVEELDRAGVATAMISRSEERRVGKECRSRWWPSP